MEQGRVQRDTAVLHSMRFTHPIKWAVRVYDVRRARNEDVRLESTKVGGLHLFFAVRVSRCEL
eukprot:2403045-Pyramimonas_sp.AAC.1